MAGFELAVAAMFSMGPDDREPSGSLERFFSYGYSIEAKLDRTFGRVDQQPTNIVKAGWISNELYPATEEWSAADQQLLFYGMSFTNNIARELADLDPAIGILTRAAPGAPLSHSMALFQSDPWRSQADTVIVGVLSSSIPYMQGMTGLGYTPESPAPYAYPKYTLVDDELVRLDPPILDRDQFVGAYRAHGAAWDEQLEVYKANDPYWDEFGFRRSITDRSAMVRLVRRAWASRKIGQTNKLVYTRKSGYKTEHPVMAAVPKILTTMHEQCQADGQRLIVILLHRLNEPGHLDTWLSDQLSEQGIEVISTVDLFSSTDSQNYLGDGHFQHKNDRLIAQAVLDLISADE